jgi:diacylglycerol O-acyltransferase
MVQRISRATRPPAPKAFPRAAVAQSLATTLGLEGERMSKVDTAWLRMDSATNLMMIVGVWILRPGITQGALTERVSERLLPYRRFVQTARQDAAGAHWLDDPDFSIDRHVVSHVLTRQHGQSEQAALQARVGTLAMEPLDALHPLWRFELIEHYDGGSALIARIHHCIADGIALISVMMSLVDGGALPPKRTTRESKSGMDAAEDWVADTLIRPFGDLTARALEAAGGGAAKSCALLASPQQGLSDSLGQAVELARMGGKAPPSTRLIITLMSAMPSAMQW